MRAMVYRGYGGPLELAELPEPVPGPGQLQLRVRATAVNPVDWKRATGKLRMLMPVRFPCVPGFDVAGVVSALGPGVTGFALGDRVHARLRDHEGGGAAELTNASAEVTARIPDGMGFAEAAGLPLAGMTALQGLRDQLLLPMAGATARVLVVGASGGVGHLAVQLARAAGATVAGVCSARNVELVRSLGAHEVIDYTAADPYRGVAPFDLVLDCVGGPPSAWTHLLVSGGRYASTMPGPSVFLRQLANPLTSRVVRPVLLKSTAADLQLLDERVAEGSLRVVIDQRYPLERLSEAWDRSKSGRAAGKIVIELGADH